MVDDIIVASNLTRQFKVAVRQKSGFMSALKSLAKRDYVTVSAVKNVNFNVKKGEIRGLIGPNGAGKSTIIKIMSGVLYPSSGQVDVMGYKPWLQRQEYVKNIGVVFGQKSQLNWDLPALDSFNLNKRLYGIQDAVFNENIKYFKDLLGISEIVNKPVRQLSLGERMKCEFACAMLHNPPLIFLDEPTIGLDIVSKEAVRNFITRVNRDKNTTFILTTHDLSDIENLCKNITVINKGSIMFDDSLDRLRKYFTNKKIIKVQFSQPVDSSVLEPLHPSVFESMSASFEVDTSRESIKSVISNLFTYLPVADIDVGNVDIEEVIKYLYTSPEENSDNNIVMGHP